MQSPEVKDDEKRSRKGWDETSSLDLKQFLMVLLQPGKVPSANSSAVFL